MRPEEINAVGELAGEAAAGLAARIHEMHEGIAERAFNAVSLGVGVGAVPVKLAHDRITRAAYAAARGLTRGLVRGGAAVLSTGQPPHAPSLEDAPAGRIAVGALNGAFGDTIEQRGNSLALRMTLRRGDRDVELTPAGLARAFPDATSRLAVFLHGLCETDDAWKLGAARHVPYGFRLQAELGFTPLYIRYNSGRHVSDNGRELARLLDRLTASWPVQVHEIVLIGHSMGGLVSRSACHYCEADWTGKVRHVFTLGAPHLGAPLEQLANAAGAALARLPETRGLATALNLRSAGIKDLRYGFLVEEDWFGVDCDAYLRRTAREVTFLRTANHYFVCATLSRERDAPVGRIIGDLLVLPASAWHHEGRGKRMRFSVDHYRHVGGANHFDLLNHPAIYGQIRKWLGAQRLLEAGDPAHSLS